MLKSQRHLAFNMKSSGLVLLTLSILFSVAGFFIYIQSQTVQTTAATPAAIASLRREAPDFLLPDAQGNKHHLKDFRGSTVVLHFWASWCPPCLDEIPQWVELGAAFKSRPVKWVAISLDKVWDDALKILPDQKNFGNIISLLDSSGKTPDQYDTFQFPETYLIGPDLKIIMKWVGPQNWSNPKTREFIERQL